MNNYRVLCLWTHNAEPPRKFNLNLGPFSGPHHMHGEIVANESQYSAYIDSRGEAERDDHFGDADDDIVSPLVSVVLC
jgi:hypothetical protein